MNAIIVGASYTGLIAALELRQLLPAGDTVTVVSANEDFILNICIYLGHRVTRRSAE